LLYYRFNSDSIKLLRQIHSTKMIF